jgi:hypothetical protein
MKIYGPINSAEDLCTVNYTKLSVHKTQVLTFSKTTNVLICWYQVFQHTITRTDTTEDLGIFIDSKTLFS